MLYINETPVPSIKTYGNGLKCVSSLSPFLPPSSIISGKAQVILIVCPLKSSVIAIKLAEGTCQQDHFRITRRALKNTDPQIPSPEILT